MENLRPPNQQCHWNNTILPAQLGLHQCYVSSPYSTQYVSPPSHQPKTETGHANFAQLSGKKFVKNNSTQTNDELQIFIHNEIADSMVRRLQTPDLNDVIWGRKGRWVRCPHYYECVTTILTYGVGPMAVFIALICLVW